MNRRIILGVILSLVVLTTAVMATIIDYWSSSQYTQIPSLPVNSTGTNGTADPSVTMDNETVTRHEGLWRTCVKSDTGTKCKSVTTIEDYHWIHACQALMIVGSVAVAVATIIPCVPIINVRIAAACAIFGGICFSVSVIVFAVKHSDLYAAFGMAVMAGQIATVSGLVLWTTFGAQGYREI